MNTTQTLNTDVAIGLATKASPTISASARHPASPPATHRKTLVLGLLAVASCTAALLCFKAAVAINEVFASLDAAYNAFCT